MILPATAPSDPGDVRRSWHRLASLSLALRLLASFLGIAFHAFGWFPSPALAAARPPWETPRVQGSPNPPAPFEAVRRYPRLRFEAPVDFSWIPGSDRILVMEQSGRLRSFIASSDDAAIHTDLALDLRRRHPQMDSVLGFAFHPGFLTNQFLFVNLNYPQGHPSGSRIVRYRFTSLDPPTVDPASENWLLQWPAGGHNGCTLAFGPDGLLYVSTGDGAGPDPPDGVYTTGQDLGDLLASILRIDVDRPDWGSGYSVPGDNPFLDRPGARPEIWAFGLRNPFRISVDPDTGDLWAGDVGWEQWEMIYRVQKGGNYGWPITEGPNLEVRRQVPQGPGPILPPVVALPHSDAASITGGRVYRGQRFERLRGAYLYGDWETGKFWALRHDQGRLVSNLELCDTPLKPVAFAEDPQGECLILDYAGGIHALATNRATAHPAPFPRRLSETGLFADVARMEPSPGVVPYRPLATMWADYAEAEFWVAVPGTGRIATDGGRETIAGRMWDFPTDTVFLRTVSLAMERGRPETRRRIESQMLHFDGQNWNGYTYRWKPDQTDGELVPAEGASERWTVLDSEAAGGKREIPWRYLGRAECFRCHNVWARDLLSFQWLQLGLPTTAGSEAGRLADLGVLEIRRPPGADDLSILRNPYQTDIATAERARSWLHVNCAGCHCFGAGGAVDLQLNRDKPVAEMRAVDRVPVRGDFGIADARIIAPGDPHRSTLYYRIVSEGASHMPHIGARLVDPIGHRVIADWIRELDNDPSAAPSPAPPSSLAATQVTELLRTMQGALAIAEALDAPSERRPGSEYSDLRRSALAAAGAHTNAMIRDLFQRFLPPDQRRATLGADFPPHAVLSLQGNPQRGQELFSGAAQCSTCHLRDGRGRPFGPDLTDIARRYSTPQQLLEQIVHPSLQVAPEFRTTTVVLADGEDLSGFVVRRTAEFLVLKDSQLAEHEVRISEIKDNRQSALSSMPEGLLAPLTAQEAADLLAYLAHAAGSASPAESRPESKTVDASP
ncbi:MAG: PQQ-dependent sugar dehydrogenase [Verrucomicrobiales bacterium]|nr:PQQ-dependent sugar dehydrogenase [Verrucomicrobiales bacterium]